jgi:hypothetical protein
MFGAILKIGRSLLSDLGLLEQENERVKKAKTGKLTQGVSG